MLKISGPFSRSPGELVSYFDIGNVIKSTVRETKHCSILRSYYSHGILIVTKFIKKNGYRYDTLYSISTKRLVKHPRVKKINHQPRLEYIRKKYDFEPRGRRSNVWFGYLRGYRRAIKDLEESGVLK